MKHDELEKLAVSLAGQVEMAAKLIGQVLGSSFSHSREDRIQFQMALNKTHEKLLDSAETAESPNMVFVRGQEDFLEKVQAALSWQIENPAD